MLRARIFLLFFVVVMLIGNAKAQVTINEVMPHSNSSLGDEWIELYNTENSKVILLNWMIGDKVSNDTISLNISAYGFAIISDSSIECSNFNVSDESCVELSTIGSGLNDDEETVYLYNNSLVDSFSWNTNIKSIGASWQIYNSTWMECTPTPGTQNSCTVQQDSSQQQTQQNQTEATSSQTSDSYLSIVEAPSKAMFGETINVDINAYRGDTSKYAVYLYIKKYDDTVSEKVSLHLDEKFKNYSFAVALKISPNCDAAYDEGNYDIIFEGLDKTVLKEITLKGNAECESEEFLKRGKVSYRIDFPDEVQEGEEFVVSVKVYNNQNKKQMFSAWSYVYKDNNCYSCGNKTREANAEQAIIGEYDSATIFLRNTVYRADEGGYNLKVKILREGYETTKDFTFGISVKNIPAQANNTNAESILNEQQFLNVSNQSQSKITGKVVYRADKQSSITAVLLLILLLLVALLYLSIKSKNYRKESEYQDSVDKDSDKYEENSEYF